MILRTVRKGGSRPGNRKPPADIANTMFCRGIQYSIPISGAPKLFGQFFRGGPDGSRHRNPSCFRRKIQKNRVKVHSREVMTTSWAVSSWSLSQARAMG